MTSHTAIQPPTYGNPTFDSGVLHGISWFQTGDIEFRQPTAQLLVDFIRDNILEPHAEGFLDDDRLSDNAGFLVGWILGEFIQ